MTAADYDAVFDLWSSSPGVSIREDDSRRHIVRFLERNPGLSLVAMAGDRCIGAVLVGHDGRRGYLHHLAVSKDFRRRGLGARLVERAIRSLAREGIERTHVFVMKENKPGQKFWSGSGWKRRDDLVMFSRVPGEKPKRRQRVT